MGALAASPWPLLRNLCFARPPERPHGGVQAGLTEQISRILTKRLLPENRRLLRDREWRGAGAKNPRGRAARVPYSNLMRIERGLPSEGRRGKSRWSLVIKGASILSRE